MQLKIIIKIIYVLICVNIIWAYAILLWFPLSWNIFYPWKVSFYFIRWFFFLFGFKGFNIWLQSGKQELVFECAELPRWKRPRQMPAPVEKMAHHWKNGASRCCHRLRGFVFLCSLWPLLPNRTPNQSGHCFRRRTRFHLH